MHRFFDLAAMPAREWPRPLTVLPLSVLLLVLFLAPWRLALADGTPPTVSLMCPTSESGSFLNTDAHGHNLSALVRFSEPVTGFPSNGTILLSAGSLIWNRQGVSVTQDGVDVLVPGSPFYFFRNGFFHGMYIFRAIVKDDVSGTVVAQVPAGVATDADGNANTASNRLRLSRNRTVSVSDTNATEGTDATIDFKVVLDGPDDCTTATVDWKVSDGTATAGEDYTAASGTLTFAPGETTKTVSISILNDSASEGVETLKLKLTNPSGVTLFAHGTTQPVHATAIGTIFTDEDSDPPSVTVTSSATAPVTGWFDALVTFSEPVSGFVMSELEVTNGSAVRITSLNDGTKHWVSIVPAPGVTGEVSIAVPAAVATDSFGHPNTASAPFVISFQAPDYPPTAQVLCRDTESNPYGIVPGKSGSLLVDIKFNAPVVEFDASAIAVTQDGVNVAGAYSYSSGSAWWYTYSTKRRDTVSGTVLVTALPGAAVDERRVPSKASSNTLHVAYNWQASISDASATEGSGNTLDFEVKLNARDDCREVTVDYATADGTATAGEDYTAVSGTLTFAPGETTKTVSVPITDDSVSDSDETFTLQLSNISGHLVELGVAEATGTITDDDPDLPIDLLTARFENVPESHDGATAFTVGLHFSENIPGLSYKTVGGGLFDVTGANVTGARRLTPGSNQDWLVTVAPGGSDDIAISLPARACGAAATICISDNRPLSEGISATVQMEPQAAQQSGGGALTARFENVPEAHDGATAFTVELHFSENIPGLSYKTVGGGLFDVTGANVTGARRLTPGSNQDWLVTVAPSVDADVTLTVPGTDDCAAPNAICVGDDRKLEAGASATITVTPIAVTVADTEVEEAEGATLDFVVTMNRASARDIQISYRAYDGTATAGEDYVAVYSSFIMTAGETTKTVSVSVLDDALPSLPTSLRHRPPLELL